MKKILVILDQEPEQKQALEKGVLLAQKMSADIHVLIQCYQPLSWVTDVFGMLENKEIKARVLEDREKWWQELSEPYSGAVNMSYEIVWSKYFVDDILSHCDENHYDLLVKKGHRSESILHTPSDWLLFRASKVPVYIVVEQEPSEQRPVLVAIDVMANNEEKQRLNDRLLSVASQYAKQMNTELHCCFAIPLPMVSGGLGVVDIEQQGKDIEESARKEAKELLEDHGIAEQNLHIATGTAWNVIHDFSESLNSGLTVIGSIGRKNIAGKLVGNTCEEYLHISRKDLLVIGLPDA